MLKKLSPLVFVAVFAFILGITGDIICQSLGLCSVPEPTPTTTPTATVIVPATATATVPAPTTATPPIIPTPAPHSTIEKIFERGYLIAGVKCDFSPMGYIQDPQEPQSPQDNRVDCDFTLDYKSDERAGFEIEIVKEFAKRWLGNESAVEFKTVKNPEENIDKLTGGEVDLVAAVMTHTKDRDERISFSQTYFDDGQGLLVTDPNIKSVEDLAGKSVAVKPDTTSSANIEAEAERLDVTIKIVPVESDDDGVKLLLNNDVDAYTTDSVRLIHLSQENPSLQFVKDQSSGEAYQFSEEPYGMGVSKGDAEFRDLVNFTLQEMKLDGTYDRIYERWFSDESIYVVETWPGKSYLDVNLISMQRIEAGEFTLSTAPEGPVSLEAFSIDQYEVTNRLYKQCVDKGECQVPQNPEQYAKKENKNHPVTWITFEQAKEYCASVGKRLPTEDEWEAAARGRDKWIYPWGNDEPNKERANFKDSYTDTLTLEVIWDTNTYIHEEHVSPYGLHQMAGNVREWVLSESGQEVTRGGGWKDTAEDIKTTARVVGVNMVADDVGFRCAVEADQFPSPLR